MDKVILQQKEALVASIKECQKREELRLKRIAQVAKASERQQLAERFDRERSLEKERIEHLRSDLMLLHRKQSEGQLDIPLSERRAQQVEEHRTHQGGKFDTAVSRFYGLETMEDVQFHADIARKFEKRDAHFKAVHSRKPYDRMDDIRRLRLLEEKRQVITQLIGLEHQNAQRSYMNTGRGANLASLQYRGSDSASAYSGYSGTTSASSRSGVSYATFATLSAPKPALVRANSTGPARPQVPRLQFS